MKTLLGILGLTVGLALPLFAQELQALSADVRSQKAKRPDQIKIDR